MGIDILGIDIMGVDNLGIIYYLCHPTYDNITMLHSIPPGCADLITSHVNTCRHISSRV